MGGALVWRTKSDNDKLIHVDEVRKRCLLIAASIKLRGTWHSSMAGKEWLHLDLLAKPISGIRKQFRRGGQRSSHHTGDVFVVDHRVSDLRSGDDETDFVTLGTLDLCVYLRISLSQLKS
jgi:hypothetical protein